MFNSKEYWINRYKSNLLSSGVGSYGIYADYKAQTINTFIEENNLKSMCELGCGDGNQLALFKPIKYYGYDISSDVVNYNKKRFISENYFFTSNIDEIIVRKYDVTISLDVLYHLIEDNVYLDYMKLLFDLSDKFVIIYSPNEDKNFNNHVKYRKFDENIPINFKLLKKIDNPLKDINTQSDFYIYVKQ